MTILSTKMITPKDVATTDLESIPEIPVYYPTMEEFKDFKMFIKDIEKRGAHHMGLCKIVPPNEWCSRKKGYSDLDLFIIPNPIEQTCYGKNGVFIQANETKESLNFQKFRRFDFNPHDVTPKFDSYDQLENEYWSSVGYSAPLYGANICGTLTDEELKIWNIGNLPNLLNEQVKESIGGVNTPYLYFGSWRSSFGWHVEDQQLYSINYLHFGLAKFWYVIPPPFARRFESLVEKLFPQEIDECPAFLRHKTVVISPEYLRRFGIPTRKIVQEENDIMITFPYGYHSGFNTGLNIAESTNFATLRWIEYGRQAIPCHCFSNTVNIDMDLFSKFKTFNLDKTKTRHPLDNYEDVLCGDMTTFCDVQCDTPDVSSDEETDHSLEGAPDSEDKSNNPLMSMDEKLSEGHESAPDSEVISNNPLVSMDEKLSEGHESAPDSEVKSNNPLVSMDEKLSEGLESAPDSEDKSNNPLVSMDEKLSEGLFDKIVRMDFISSFKKDETSKLENQSETNCEATKTEETVVESTLTINFDLKTESEPIKTEFKEPMSLSEPNKVYNNEKLINATHEMNKGKDLEPPIHEVKKDLPSDQSIDNSKMEVDEPSFII